MKVVALQKRVSVFKLWLESSFSGKMLVPYNNDKKSNAFMKHYKGRKQTDQERICTHIERKVRVQRLLEVNKYKWLNDNLSSCFIPKENALDLYKETLLNFVYLKRAPGYYWHWRFILHSEVECLYLFIMCLHIRGVLYSRSKWVGVSAQEEEMSKFR